jgi:hypothetical protein
MLPPKRELPDETASGTCLTGCLILPTTDIRGDLRPPLHELESIRLD